MIKKILATKRRQLKRQKKLVPYSALLAQCKSVTSKKNAFLNSLRKRSGIRVIAELKRASPSSGIIRRNFEPLKIIKDFERGGAVAISVLTEECFFLGGLDVLRVVRASTELPLLRKDFIFDRYQIFETKASGADAYLLIASLLSSHTLKKLIKMGERLGLDALVEVHNRHDLSKALKANAKIIGINNRNLKTLKVDNKLALKLLPLIPKSKVIVIESGMQTQSDLSPFIRCNIRCFLIGTSLMRSKNIRSKLRQFQKRKGSK